MLRLLFVPLLYQGLAGFVDGQTWYYDEYGMPTYETELHKDDIHIYPEQDSGITEDQDYQYTDNSYRQLESDEDLRYRMGSKIFKFSYPEDFEVEPINDDESINQTKIFHETTRRPPRFEEDFELFMPTKEPQRRRLLLTRTRDPGQYRRYSHEKQKKNLRSDPGDPDGHPASGETTDTSEINPGYIERRQYQNIPSLKPKGFYRRSNGPSTNSRSLRNGNGQVRSKLYGAKIEDVSSAQLDDEYSVPEENEESYAIDFDEEYYEPNSQEGYSDDKKLLYTLRESRNTHGPRKHSGKGKFKTSPSYPLDLEDYITKNIKKLRHPPRQPGTNEEYSALRRANRRRYLSMNGK